MKFETGDVVIHFNRVPFFESHGRDVYVDVVKKYDEDYGAITTECGTTYRNDMLVKIGHEDVTKRMKN